MQHKILNSSILVLHSPPRGVKRFPTAGNRTTAGATRNVGSDGFYWASDQYNATSAYLLRFYSSTPAGYLLNDLKLNGFPVRCVRL